MPLTVVRLNLTFQRPIAPSEVIELVLFKSVIALFNKLEHDIVSADETDNADEHKKTNALVVIYSVCREWWYIIKHHKNNFRTLRRNVYCEYENVASLNETLF